jgi:hypothetical protein
MSEHDNIDSIAPVTKRPSLISAASALDGWDVEGWTVLRLGLGALMSRNRKND